jgi:hypothetical protein
MAKVTGKDGVLESGSTDIAHIRNWTLNQSSPQIDLTAMGDTFADQSTGLPSISGNFSCWWDDASDAGQATITNGATFVLHMFPTGNSSGKTDLNCSIVVSEVVHTAAFDGGVELNVSWIGRSVVTESTVA